MKEIIIVILSIAILVGIILIYVFYRKTKNRDVRLTSDIEIYKEALIGKLENIKKMVEQNDNDLLLKVITKKEHQKQLANYNKQIDEIEKELNNI